MNKENAKVRKRLKEIESVEDFQGLLSQTMLSEEDKTILTLIYKDQKPLSYVADVLGLSISTVNKKHHKLLMKIGRIIAGTY